MPESVTMTELCSVIGEEATQKAIDAFAGRRCYFNKKPNALQFPTQAAKEEYIKNLFYAGRSPQYIAEKVGLGIDQTRTIIYKK